MNELVSLIREEIRGDPGLPLRIPYPIGLAGGYLADAAALVLRRPLPVSSVRVRKFCATTRVRRTGAAANFDPPFSIREGLTRMIRSMSTS